MSRHKKPDAPKFEPVAIAGLRPQIYALGTSQADTGRIYAEDMARIKSELAPAVTRRLEILREHLNAPEDNLFLLLLAVADKYVHGFKITIGAQPKRGAKKVGDRFKTVTEVESMKILQHLPTIAAAIDAVAATRRPAIRPQELSTKYYACLREIEANKTADALLRMWRHGRETFQPSDSMQEFEELFWSCERDCLGATLPHNVTPLKAREK